MNALALLLALLGFTALCLGMDKHYEKHLRHPPTPWRLRGLRALGWLCLALSFAASIAAAGWQIGPLLWFGWLSVAGYVLVFAKPWLRRGAGG
ncbi:DUF3325 domain-containing protein [Ottowia sp.]|uniref:DUF3325 domain-containing protein n=1 Tax=Ottowia sp. TaxID=1898956 RepID=UPI0039E40728